MIPSLVASTKDSKSPAINGIISHNCHELLSLSKRRSQAIQIQIVSCASCFYTTLKITATSLATLSM